MKSSSHKFHSALLALGIAAVFVLLSFVLASCGTPSPAVSYAPPVQGGRAFLPPTPPALPRSDKLTPVPVSPEQLPAIIVQGDNANTPTTYAQTTTTTLVQGTAEQPKSIVVPPAESSTPMVVGVIIGSLMLLGAGALMYFGWPQIAWRLGAAGIVVIVISMTASKYGWLYALAVIIGIGILIWEKVHAYNLGLNHAAIPTSGVPTPPTPTATSQQP